MNRRTIKRLLTKEGIASAYSGKCNTLFVDTNCLQDVDLLIVQKFGIRPDFDIKLKIIENVEKT